MIFNGSINVNPGLESKLKNKVAKAQFLLDNRIVNDMNPFTPFRGGELAESANKEMGKGIITNRVPYARKQYYGVDFNYNKQFHSQATHHWFEKAKVLYKRTWINIVQTELNKRD